MKKRSISILLPLGLFFSFGSQILAHFVKMPDMISGTLFGMGIGLALLSLLQLRKARA